MVKFVYIYTYRIVSFCDILLRLYVEDLLNWVQWRFYFILSLGFLSM